jgi:amino acid transporter
MTVGALVSVYGYLGSMMLNVPRLTFALAERADFPPFFARVHPRFRTPHISIVAFALMVWGLAVAGTFRWNVMLSAVARLFTYAPTCAAVLALRKKRPDEAAFLMPAGKLAAVLGVAFSLMLVTRMGWSELMIVAVTFALASLNWIWARRV